MLMAGGKLGFQDLEHLPHITNASLDLTIFQRDVAGVGEKSCEHGLLLSLRLTEKRIAPSVNASYLRFLLPVNIRNDGQAWTSF
jgi:hypothetical protein